MAAPDKSTAQMVATRKAFGDAITAFGDKYKNLVVLEGDLSNSVMTTAFSQKFPERHFCMGIAEQDLVDTAAGFSMAGKIPFACSFCIFLTGIGWQQIRNAICYPNLNVKLIGSHGGIQIGEDGATHQALEDFAIMRVIPNMKVFCPADAIETKQIIETILSNYGPTYVRLGRQPVPVIYDEKYKFQIGKGSILMDGDDIGILAVGSVVGPALEAARMLQKDGISVRVVNMSSLKPFDEALTIETARKVKMLVTAEDHQIIGGLAGAVADVLTTHYPRKFFRIGMEDRFGESGKPADLYRKYGLDSQGIYDKTRGFWKSVL